MKKKEKASYHQMTVEELKSTLAQVNGELKTLLVTKQTKQIKNTREERQMRRKRAVIQSILRVKELAHE